jgi:hypothetical protein
MAQIETKPSNATSPPQNARYEVVQSSLAAKWTFLLDRFTGRVFQLVRTPTDGVAWEVMAALRLPNIANPTQARFQLFTSGIAARHTFLIDTSTGASWSLVSSIQKNDDGTQSEIPTWEPFE